MKFSPYKLSGSLVFLILLSTLMYAEGGAKKLNKTAAPSAWPYAYMNINNISTLIYADGQADIDSFGNSGFIYPKGSLKAVVYESGFLWAGKINGEVRANGSTYISGLRPGRILSTGVPGDPSQARIYRVRRDYKTADLSSEINDKEGTESEIRERYDTDWKEWPALSGAPYEDVDHNGQYNPSVDIPGEPGADETIWFVANDLDLTTSHGFLGSNPIGIEMQCTVYALRSPGSLKNMIFKKYKLINKSSASIDSMYTMAWGDLELGDATDDLAGCDTLLSLGYLYNARSNDNIYNDTPPAVGFALLQGPAVKGSASDTAYLNGRRLPGMKNLPMTSVGYVLKSAYQFAQDVTIGGNYKEGTLRLYNYMQGKVINGHYFPLPAELGGGETRFPFSGDPVAKTGFLDGVQYVPGDRRMGVNSGPFTIAPGDTQEVVFAEIAAGATPGVNNLHAVTLLKNSALFAREFYRVGRQGISSLSSPALTAGEYDREIVLNWGGDQAQVNKIESFNFLTHKFQGYNVYQLPFDGAKLSEGKRIAVFDIIDSVKIIYGEVINWETGAQERLAQQFGRDSGIQRYLRITEDAYTKQSLINGKKYYFAVTAYSFSPGLDPSNMESTPSFVEVTPHSNDPGVVYNSSFGDTLNVFHVSGKSDGEVIPLVVDPRMLTGDEYSLEFDTVNGKTLWKVTDITKNKILLNSQPFLEEGDGYPIADGILFKVIRPGNGMKPDLPYLYNGKSGMGWFISAGERILSFNAYPNLNLEGFGGAIGAGKTWLGSSVGYEKMKNILIKFAAADTNGNVNPGDPDVSFAYRYLIGSNLAPAKDAFAQFIANKAPGFAFQDFKRNFPFAAYDIEDRQNPRRLAVGYLENNVPDGLVDGKYWPPLNIKDNTSTSSPREWFFIFDTDYVETPDAALSGDLLSGTMPVLIHATVTRRYPKAWSGEDEMVLLVNHPFTSEDKFTFKSIAPVFDGQSAKTDVERINVFPNPYYGANSGETNRYQRFVTFNHLPQKATIRIFNLAGQIVRTIRKESTGQFAQWDLRNEHNFQAASGIYLVHIDMPELGKTKILKLAVIQEEIVPERY
ncbi:MAG: T9SS type A sorting domain-containing protein [Acidobacteriota bacterium]